jgi:hypothetical protein
MDDLVSEANPTPATGGSEPAADRRGFMRRLLAGSVAAGGVALAVAEAEAQVKAVPIGPALPDRIEVKRGRPLVRLTFNQERPPSLDEVAHAVAKVGGWLGCTGCGFDGFDLHLAVNPVFDPEPWVAEVETFG